MWHQVFVENSIVETIAKKEKIHSTLFFSRKAQKEFLRLVFSKGLDEACKEITMWREQLVKKEVLNLLKKFVENCDHKFLN